MKINIPYGNENMELVLSPLNFLASAVPNNTVMEKKEACDIITEALRNPLGSMQLKDLVKGKEKITIIISDYTRPTPSAFLLPFIIDELLAGDIDKEKITIVTASGLHDPSTESDLQRMLGDYYGNLTVINHDADDNDNLVYLGETSRKTPIYINKYVMDADIKISIGCIEPHHSAGWSGGSKNVLPGVAGRDTIYAHHSLAHWPGVQLGMVNGNPFREDLDEVGTKVGIDFILNLILNDKKEIIAAYAGDLIKAHRAGVELGKSLLAVKIKEHPDIVIVTPGGAPRDANFWQAEGKALTRIKHVVKENGIIILVAKGEEGIGKAEFAEILAENSKEDIITNFKKEPFTVLLNKAFRLAQVLDKAQLYIVSEGLNKSMFPKLPIKFFTSVQDALNEAFQVQGQEAKVLVVPKAPQVIIEVSNDE